MSKKKRKPAVRKPNFTERDRLGTMIIPNKKKEKQRKKLNWRENNDV